MDLPLAVAFAMFTSAAVRTGQPPRGPSYQMRDVLDAMERADGK